MEKISREERFVKWVAMVQERVFQRWNFRVFTSSSTFRKRLHSTWNPNTVSTRRE